MEIIRTDGSERAKALRAAVQTLNSGGIVAYPTETFYGLGVRYDLAKSLARLHALKRRPSEKAMPLIIGEREAIGLLAPEVSDMAAGLMERFWPGPLTILLPARPGLSGHISANGKVAVRLPGESFALDLARAAGLPLTATSANPSGLPPACDAGQVAAYFGAGIDLVIDGGSTRGGLPSTVVDVEGDRITVVRRGEIDPSLIGEARR
jgi:L-threonylcarbamoyladenylate synthase